MQILVFVPLFLTQLSQACTYFEVPTSKVGLVLGRSMELGDLLAGNIVGAKWMNWHVAVHPRPSPTKFGFLSVDGVGYEWLHKISHTTLITDGLNEKGLSVSANTFRGSVYESRNSTKPKVLWWDVVKYVLENFGTVKEAIEGLKGVAVVEPLSQAICDTGACFHYALADASGDSAMVEFVKGRMEIWEGRNEHVGVMTNDPGLDWQITNLNQYVNLRPDWPNANAKIEQHLRGGVSPQARSRGFNLLGLPGDSTPASRFVRIFFLREYALANNPDAVATMNSTIALATGLLNNVYLVKGTVAKHGPLDNDMEYTPWAVVKIPKAGVYMYRTASDMGWKEIPLKNIDFSSPIERRIQLSVEEVGIQDVTSLLTPKQPSAEIMV